MSDSLHASSPVPYIPLELKFEIISYMDNNSLLATALTDHALSIEAERYLYRDVVINEAQMRTFQVAITKDDARAKNVRSCTLTKFDVSDYAVVHGVLRALSNLKSLSILPTFTDMEMNYSWNTLLDGCDFQLSEFKTSFDCNRALVDFLATQKQITKYSHSGYTPEHCSSGFLHPTVFPSLNHFHGNIMDLNFIVPRRPVTRVSVQECIASIGLTIFVLRPLAASQGPIEHLSLSLMDPVTANTIQLIHTHTPFLRHLNLSFPHEEADIAAERAWSLALGGFKFLEHLGVETHLSPEGETRSISLEDQEQLVHHWHGSCALLSDVHFRAEVLEEFEMDAEQKGDQWTLEGRTWVHSEAHAIQVDKGW